MVKPYYFIEASPYGGIKVSVQVSGGNQKTTWLYLIDEDQKTVDHASQFTVIVAFFPRPRNRVKFIEKKYAWLAACKLKGLANIGGSLAQK